MHFHKVIHLDNGKYTYPIPLINSFGSMYPSLYDELLEEIFHIQPEEKVIDIGGGNNPFKRADIVTEPYLTQSNHRSGKKIVDGVEYIQCYAESIPFPELSFDFAMVRQVLEHVNDPEKACNEIMRIAKRGFIETPQRNMELLLGTNPSHQWFVSLKENCLIFEKRKFIRHPFRNLGLSHVLSSTEGQRILHWELKNVTNVQFYWEKGFPYKIIDHEDGFDYSNPIHASEAHLDIAICSLLHGGYYLEQRQQDAREAIRLRPDWDLAHNTLGIILWKQQRYDEARKEFIKAFHLHSREEYRWNTEITNIDQEPIIVDFENTLPMDKKYMDEIMKESVIDIFGLFTTPKKVIQ